MAPGKPITLSPEVRHAAVEAGRAIRGKYRAELDAEPKRADRLARLFRRTLRPYRAAGKAPFKHISLAYKMWKEQRRNGKLDWQLICSKCLPGWDELPKGERFYEREKLRRAVKMRARRKRAVDRPAPPIVSAT